MIYLAQYVNRKGQVLSKRFEAPNPTAIKDRIRREGAKESDIVIFPEGRGYFCKQCRRLVEGYESDKPCTECAQTSNM